MLDGFINPSKVTELTTFDLKRKIGLLGRYWEILERLREGARPTLTWLANELKKDKSQVSRELNELRDEGLVDFVLEGKTKIWRLTEDGLTFVSHLYKAIEEVEKKRRAGIEAELWKVDQILSMIDDEELDKDLRDSRASRLHELVSPDPVLAFERSERLRQAFESWIRSPPTDEIGWKKREVISASMAKLASSDKIRGWVLLMYPNVKNLLKDERLEIKKWAIGLLGDIARSVPAKRKEITYSLLENLFDPSTKLTYEPPPYIGPGVDGYRGELAKLLKSELEKIFPTLTEEEKNMLTDYVKGRAKSRDETVRLKAKWLIEALI